jgi:hypothetical protein
MNTIQAGRLGEAAIAAEFVRRGYDVYMPIFGNADFDMIASKDGILSRVEVKCCSYERYPGKYEVQLKSVRPNRTKNTIKVFDGSRSDLLAIYLPPVNKVVILNSADYNGRNSVLVNGDVNVGSVEGS